MWTGVFFALAAGLMWGLVFVGPLLLPEYPAVLQTVGRYLAFGLIALPMGWLDRRELAKLSRADWLEALKLAAVGNLLYYLCLSSAIQRAGGPLPTMMIGTLPVVIGISANLRNHQRDGRLPWRQLAPSLMLIALGIACVNQVELQALRQNPQADTWAYAMGAILAAGAVLCWTWYPLRNADWLRGHPNRSPRTWATAQGLATLPLAALGYLGFGGYAYSSDLAFALPFGPRPALFVGLMVAMGLFASWLGTLCWNEASQRLPTATVGQLIVFETLSALLYAFLLRGQWPEPLTLLGIGLLVGGVLWAARIQPEPTGLSLPAE
ncbi:inner membrane protein YtfF [Rhodoferax lithotrophicus]|uniref:Inner membrane protein YtfF n=1 Tax=Rhodoferax lithotrophicus TaxID=2798804 RepID=A0ABM7MTL1_9BURK|nr:DMT family transporter [Rhodoferax sp. MIZ03]BCO29724.1 inner membrane protein YtfF [Rhodoferax sp. MIZ03]